MIGRSVVRSPDGNQILKLGRLRSATAITGVPIEALQQPLE